MCLEHRILLTKKKNIQVGESKEWEQKLETRIKL